MNPLDAGPPEAIQTRAVVARRIARTTLLLASVALLGKAIGFFRQIVIARTYGTGPDLDAYFVAVTLPEMAATLSMFVSLNLFLPLYVSEREARGNAAALAAAFLGRLSGILLVASALLAGLAPWLVHALAPEMEGAYYRTAVASLRVLSFTVLLRGLEGGFRGVLNAHRRFFLPTLVAVSVNLVVIACVLGLAAELGIMALTWGTLAGSVVPVLVVLPLAARTLPGLFRRPAETHPRLVEVRRLLPWIIAIEACGLVLPLIDRALADRYLPDGRISALAFGRLLYEVPFDLAGITLAVTLFPELALFHARGDVARFRTLVRRGVRAVVVVLLPVAVLLVAFPLPVVRAVYERGAFDAAASALTAHAVWAYATGLPLLGVAILLGQAVYATRRLRAYLFVRLGALAVKLVLSWALIPWLGHAGIALGTTAFFLVLVVALLPGAAGGWRGVIPRPGALLGAIAAALATAGALNLAFAQVGAERGLAGFGAQALVWSVSALAYLAVCRWGRIEEVLWAERWARRRLLGREGAA
jgi:putative peptidoglycan lipid II flippase